MPINSTKHGQILSNSNNSHYSRTKSNDVLDMISTASDNSLLKNVSSSYSIPSVKSSTSSIGFDIIKSKLNKDWTASNSNQIVVSILKMIKKLNKVQHRKLNLDEFIDMIHDMVYGEVSLILIDEFKACYPLPIKNHYLHYYMFFLKYAEYYHFKRCKSEFIDISKSTYHNSQLINIQDQLQFMYNIILSNKDKQQTEISL
jgi:hypothetical protein